MKLPEYRRIVGKTGRVLLAALCVAVVVPPLGPAPASANSAHCRRQSLVVTLTPQASTRYHVVGWLCGLNRRADPGTAVQVLMSGLTYSHRYWDMPYRGLRYSYVAAATRAGHVVFSVDRIGVGESDRPPAGEVSVASEEYVAHQVVQALRAGVLGGIHFRTVTGVGHSMGSAIWMYEAARWRDVDGLVLTSYLHQPNVAQQQLIAASLHPAGEDPVFAGRGDLDGYFTTVPGSRLGDFYLPSAADPAVVALDEALKQTVTAGELATLNLARDPTYSRAIQVPVLLLVGEYDSLGCDPSVGLDCQSSDVLYHRETGYYSRRAHLTACVIPNSGHSLNLHPNAGFWFAIANEWIAALIGQRHWRGPGCRTRGDAGQPASPA
jgi:pimeloyl-ACP methyl ester carboxylesterase